MSTAENVYSSCDVCRLRKLKCSKESPSCWICRNEGLICVYSPKEARTALTRVNLDRAEHRARELEDAFAALLPDVDLGIVLQSFGTRTDRGKRRREFAAADSAPRPGDTAHHKNGSMKLESDTDTHKESLPLDADGFDWAESEVSVDGLSDGMAALSVKPEGTGYLGSASSVVPLRALLNSDRPSASQPSSYPGLQPPTPNPNFTPVAVSHVSELFLIDAYFTLYHAQYPFLHEPTFRAQFYGTSPRPRGHSWPILLNTVLALGAWCVGSDQSFLDETYYQQVTQLTRDHSVFETGNLALVQAVLLLSNYTQKRNRPNSGWNYLGLAVRMALSLGLHKDFPNWNISPLQREMRRRVWWGVYIFDSGASITFGRPVLLPDRGIMDGSEVLNIREESLTSYCTARPPEEQIATIYSGLISQSRFHIATNDLYNQLISSPEPNASDLLSFGSTIDTWEQTIPSYFQLNTAELSTNETLLFSCCRLNWRSWNFRIVLYRPVLLRWAGRRAKVGTYSPRIDETAEEVRCREICLESARNTIRSVADSVTYSSASRLRTWYTLYFLFQAALIPVVLLTMDPLSVDAILYREDIQTAQKLLRYTYISNNKLAARCLEVLDRLCAPALQSDFTIQDPLPFDATQNVYSGDQFGNGMEFWDWLNTAMQD